MRKKELQQIKKLMATDEMVQIAKQKKMEDGSLYQKEWFLKAIEEGRLLKVSVFLAEYLRFGGKEPIYDVYVDREEENFLTFDCRTGKWSTAMMHNLNWPEYARHPKVICDAETAGVIQTYFGKEGNPYDIIQDYQLGLREKQLAERNRAVTSVWEEKMEQVPEVPKDWEHWKEKVGITRQYIFYFHQKGGAKEGYCTWCEQMVPVNGPNHNKMGTCRKCRHQIQYKSIRKQKKVYTGEETMYLLQKCKDGFVVREFRGWNMYWMDDYKNPRQSFRECRRIFYDRQLHSSEFYFGEYKREGVLRWIEGEWIRQGAFYSIWEPYYAGRIYGRTLPSMEKKELRRTGFSSFVKENAVCCPVAFLRLLQEQPCVELLIKAGLRQIVNEMMESRRIDFSDSVQGNLAKALGIDGFRLNRLRKNNGGVTYLKWLRLEKKQDRVIEDPVILWLEENRILPEDLAFISDRMSERQIKNYLVRQSRETKETAKQLISIWRDYLIMAKRLKYDVYDAIVYRARHLLKRHREVIESAGNRDLVIRAGNIAEKYPKIEPIFDEMRERYSFKGKTYQILVPKSIEDVLTEGETLHHCINRHETYFERIHTRESYILFLRKTEAPETPYYTLEVEPDGTVRQKRTLYDRQLPDIEQAEQFLRQWQKQLRRKLKQEDLELASKSQQLRKMEISRLREQKVVIHGGDYGGKLLADVLEQDLMELCDAA